MSSQPQSGPSLEPRQRSPMRLLVTGGTGVLGRALRPLAKAAGHELAMPGHEELDLFDPARGRRRRARRRRRPAPGDPDPFARADLGSGRVARERSASRGRFEDPRRRGDRGRGGGLRPADGHVCLPAGRARCPRTRQSARSLPILRSALVAEQETERFARAGGRGVVLRFGLLDGPGTWFEQPMARLRRHAARRRCRARAPLGAVAAERHLQRLP